MEGGENIIHVDFGGKIKSDGSSGLNNTPKKTEKTTRKTTDRLAEFRRIYTDKTDLLEKLLCIEDKMKKISNLRASKEALQLHSETVKGFTDAQLLEYITNGNDSDFSTKPGFFTAIVLELLKRAEIPIQTYFID